MVCLVYPETALCVTAFIVQGVPLLILFCLLVHQIRTNILEPKASRLPLLIIIEAFLGSVFYFAGLFPDDAKQLNAALSPSLLCWEVGGLTLFLSWRLLHKLVKNLSRYTESQERSLMIVIFAISFVVFPIIIPCNIAAAYGSFPNFFKVIMWIHICFSICLLFLAVFWLFMLRKTLTVASLEHNHPATIVIRRMMVVCVLIMVVISFTIINQVTVTDITTYYGSIMQFLCGISAHAFFIYAEWPRKPSAGEKASSSAKVPQESSRAPDNSRGPSSVGGPLQQLAASEFSHNPDKMSQDDSTT